MNMILNNISLSQSFLCDSCRELLKGEKGFVMFCEGSAAKEQWFSALRWNAEGGGAAQAVQELYRVFCAGVRSGASVTYDQV